MKNKKSFELGLFSSEFWKFLNQGFKNLVNSKLKTQNLKLTVTFTAALFAVLSPVFAQSDETAAKPKASWGSVDLGVKYVGWQSSAVSPDNGYEILAPLTLSIIPWKGGKIYG